MRLRFASYALRLSSSVSSEYADWTCRGGTEEKGGREEDGAERRRVARARASRGHEPRAVESE